MELIERTPPHRYLALQKYLDDRYANTVVLFFKEIEDILGFALPAGAWLQCDWWSNPAPDDTPSDQSRSWTSANRTADVNIPARKVTFTRTFA